VIRNSILVGHKFYKPPEHLSPPLPEEFTIGEECVIEKAIIDEHCRIGNRVQLINKNQVQNLDGDGIYIRDGIIIVTSGARIPDGFIL
jgi:glucose-1-phosphate adenylyltransferase